MSYDPKKIALYCQGTFSAPNPNSNQQAAMIIAAKEIADAGFGTVFLGQWHVHTDGTLYYNDTPYTKTNLDWALSNIPVSIKSTGKVQYVTITFGPFGSDFDNITANLSLFKKTMLEIFTSYKIDGIDFDIEGSFTTANQNTLLDLTNWANSLGKIITAAPYDTNNWWTALLKQTNNFAWWNLQMYGGAIYSSWVGYLTGISKDPQSFLTYGFNAENETPQSITAMLQDTRKTYPNLNGAFIWKYETITGQAAIWAKAIINGLS